MYQGRYQAKTTAQKRPKRRRKLNKSFLVTLSVILLLGMTIGGTVAYIAAKSDTVKNSFTPGSVLCSVNNRNEVTNDGNVDAYIRAAVVVNWGNSEGDINGIAPKEGANYKLDLGDDWTKIGDYYYYTKVVTPDGETEKTTPVVTVSKPANAPDAPEDFELVVEILAEAIQAEGATDDGDVPAITDAWGVDPTTWTEVQP